MQYVKLGPADSDEVMSFALRAPEMNVVLIHNMARFGMERGDGPFNADYMGLRGPGGLRAVGAFYNLGALFFRAESPESVSGMGACIAGLGRLPAYTAGTRPHVRVLLDELAPHLATEPELIPSQYMVLEGEATDVPRPAGVVRPAAEDDLDTLVRLQSDFELEAFGKSVVDEDSLRKLLSFQMTEGAAVVVEREGRIVSKAEATIARPHAALVGGVYTVPEMRGQGLSTACMGALCEELLSQVPAVGLNVFEDNHAARRVYLKTGFVHAEDWLTAEMSDTG